MRLYYIIIIVSLEHIPVRRVNTYLHNVLYDFVRYSGLIFWALGSGLVFWGYMSTILCLTAF